MQLKKIFSKKKLLFFFIINYSFSQAQQIFIENKGQFPSQVLAKTKLPSGALFIEKGELTFSFYNQHELIEAKHGAKRLTKIQAHSYKIKFYKPNKKSVNEFLGPSRFFENYYLGEKNSWAEKVKTYEKYYEKDLYKGIDLKMYIQENKLKYEFIVSPKTKTTKIKYTYNGVDDIFLKNKNLYIKTSVNTVIEESPYAYQIINKDTVNIVCEYKLRNKTITYFFPKGYNENYELIIDPTLIFSTYSGSIANNFGYTATYDNQGFLYSGSTVFGVGYPVTRGAFQIDFSGGTGLTSSNPGTDIAITKYDTTGENMIYSTYIGGKNDELPHSLIVNEFGELFLLGTTGSSNYPTTKFAYDTSFNGGYSFPISGLGVSFPNGSDIVASKLSSNGGFLLASTFIGGSSNDGLNLVNKLNYNYADEVRGEIEIDKENNIYIASCTKSNDFPTTAQSFQPTASLGQEGCIVKLDNNLTTLIWGSYLGSTEQEAIYSIAISENNDIYVCGGTTSPDFPTTKNAYQKDYLDSLKADAFISMINSEGTEINYSSFFGSQEYDQAYFVEIGKNKEVYLLGQTEASGKTLVFNANYFQKGGGQFIAVFSETLDFLKKATVIGTGKGGPDISPTAFLVDACNRIYFSGWGSQDGNLGWQLSTLRLPITTNAYQNTTDGHDFYLMVLDENLDSLIYATYFGGSQSKEHVDGGTSRFDKKGIVYQCVCAGCGGNNDFPTTQGALSDSNGTINANPPIINGCNSAVFKFNIELPMVIADFLISSSNCNLNTIFQNISKEEGATNYFWDFGDNTTSTQINPTHTYMQSGIYEVTLIASSLGSCNKKDTITKHIYIMNNSIDTIPSIKKCKSENIQIGIPSSNTSNIRFSWLPSIGLSNNSVPNPYSMTDSTIQYMLIAVDDNNCTDTIIQTVLVNPLHIDAGMDTIYCSSPIELEANELSSRSNISLLWSSNRFFSDTLSVSNKLTINQTGIYYIKANDGECESKDSVNVFSKNLEIELISDSNNCKGDSVYIQVNNNTTTQINSLDWNTQAIFYNKDSSITQYIIDTSRWYTVTAKSIEGCISQDSIYISYENYPSIYSIWAEDSIIYKGEKTTLYVDSEDSIVWVFENNYFIQDSLLVSPEEDKIYHVEIYNNHCKKEENILIQVKSVFCNQDSIKIPNAFTPTENINKTYFISAPKDIITYFNLEIFNRIGERVFKSNRLNQNWDGRKNGVLFETQVFDFYLEIRCIGGGELFRKGNITLIR